MTKDVDQALRNAQICAAANILNRFCKSLRDQMSDDGYAEVEELQVLYIEQARELLLGCIDFDAPLRLLEQTELEVRCGH